MNRRVFALVAVLLWLGAPGVVRAESRAFEFSSRGASVRLTGKRPVKKRLPRTTADRIRLFTAASTTTTVSDTADDSVPTHLWLVPLVLTGAGLFTGVGMCALGSDDGSCGRSILGGLVLGMSLSLSYLRLVACAEGDDSACDDLCDDDCAEDAAARKSRARAKVAKATNVQRRPGGLRLPMGLSPAMGIVHDQAVIGLGRSF
ncbi:hypothetical protein LZ198_17390 [Myxococcus sp. K15C18031901]|uniref:hypothetical protein n=1 Tax=Myxococcus dinghuensis TaxID=2906761 RepID=UPI0020A7FCD1|nr:hypothetical protein [Myxococcus dinghuensis]MCP3100646.1 hypothetical protein [Myxococcus dinghuensis]